MDRIQETRPDPGRGKVSVGGSIKVEAQAHTTSGAGEETGRRFSWRTLGVVVGVAAATSLLLIPFSMTLLGQGDGPEIPSWILVVGTLIQGVVSAAIFGGLGLWLGPKVGLGTPDLRDILHGVPGSGRRVLSALPLAAGMGAALGAVLLALAAGFGPLFPEAVRRSFDQASIPPPWEGFLASISAGVNEEILFRLGLMTLFVYLGAKLLRQGGRPAAGVVWTAMVLATLLFGAVHLPQAAEFGGALPASLVAYVLLGNGLGGLVFGWLYWKRGLLTAVTAHFAADVVLYVIAPTVALLASA
jgi:membrane protease YdiL (CAAX protease family)